MRRKQSIIGILLSILMITNIFPTIKAAAASFTPRYSLSYEDTQSKYWASGTYGVSNGFPRNWNSGYSGGNCTWYAFGRAWELLGSLPNLCTNNAGAWYSYNKSHGYYPYGSTPKLGAIACWDHYDNDTGHVAVVEEIGSNYIVCSESGWSYTNGYFSTKTRSLNDSTLGMGSSYRFLGYIYIIDADPIPPSNARISIDKENIKCGETFKITCTSDTSSQYYLAIFDADSGEKIIAENVPSGIFQNSFQKAGKYNAYMTAYNSAGSVNSNWITFYVFGNPPTTASLSIDKTQVKKNEKITFKSSSNAYYVKIYISIFRNDNLIYSGDIPYTFEYTPPVDGTYTAHMTAYTHEGGANSNWVTFNVGNSTPTTSTTAARTNGTIEVQTTISNLSQSASCVAAVYDSSGKLLGQTANDVNSSTNSVTAYFTNYSNASYVKVFLWDSLEGMKPLTNGEKVNL